MNQQDQLKALAEAEMWQHNQEGYRPLYPLEKSEIKGAILSGDMRVCRDGERGGVPVVHVEDCPPPSSNYQHAAACAPSSAPSQLNRLDNKVEVYVPSSKHGGPDPIIEPIRQGWLDKVQAVMVDLFGGCSVVEAFGSYLSNDGELQRQRVSVVYSYCSEENMLGCIKEIWDLAGRMRIGMVQECVAVVVNGQMSLIS